MDCCARCQAIPALEASPAAAAARSPGGRRLPIGTFAKLGSAAGGSRCLVGLAADFQGIVKICRKRGYTKREAPALVTVASAESNKCEFRCVGTPLEPQSPAGRFLSGVLKNQPHIFPMASAEQLEDLALERDGALARRDHSLGTAESCLHRRVAEVKEHECEIAIEEVMYMLIVHKFAEIKVPMVSRLSKCMSGCLDIWPSKDIELESIYSSEVLEMVREHLSNILGQTGTFGMTVSRSTAQIRRLQLGRIYAASIMFGYFLKSVTLRHRLELNLSLTSEDYPLNYLIRVPHTKLPLCELENFASLGCLSNAVPSLYLGRNRPRKGKRLRSYVMRFDPNTLQICAKLRSREAVNLIEKHSWALFGDQARMSLEDDDEVVSISFSGIKRLVLEAVAFGSFLWDVEGHVDSVYRLKEN